MKSPLWEKKQEGWETRGRGKVGLFSKTLKITTIQYHTDIDSKWFRDSSPIIAQRNQTKLFQHIIEGDSKVYNLSYILNSGIEVE